MSDNAAGSGETAAALTPSEWNSSPRGGPGTIVRGRVTIERMRDLFMGKITPHLGIKIEGNMGMLEREDCHAVAALCLFEQSFGFTAEDVEAIKLASIAEQFWSDEDHELAKRLPSIASRLRALLPPSVL